MFYEIVFWKALIPLPKSSNGLISHFYAVLDKKERLRKPENHSRVEIRLVIRPFTLKVNSQLRGLASIRKGLGTEMTSFLVSLYSIIASENVSGRVYGEKYKKSRKSYFCKSGGVII